jgi:hypothetical protein
MIGGDLNFALGASEIWGSATNLDPIVEFLIHNLEGEGIFDIQPAKYSPTWRNMHSEES